MTQKVHKAGEITEDDMMGEGVEAPSSQSKPIAEKDTPAEAVGGLLDFPDRAELEEKLTQLEKELAASKERELHVRADIDNIRRRSEREVAEAHKYGIRKLLEELIPVMDSLEQSLTVEDASHAMVKSMRDGMGLTLQMLQKVLEKFGVKEICPLQQPFDPALHEVMLAQEDAKAAPNTVLSVLQKGYQLHERLIRPARVIVAKAPATVEK